MIGRACLIVLVILVVGCSAATAPLSGTAPASIITPSAGTLSSSTGTPTVTPTAPVGSTRIISNDTSPNATPPETTLHAPTASRAAGRRTYQISSLHLSVDYPPDWTPQKRDNGVVFTSPSGESIYLMPLDTRATSQGGEFVQPNTRCFSSTNAQHISMRSCMATIGSSLVVDLDLRAAGGVTGAVISTQDRGAFGVLNALAESARIAP